LEQFVLKSGRCEYSAERKRLEGREARKRSWEGEKVGRWEGGRRESSGQYELKGESSKLKGIRAERKKFTAEYAESAEKRLKLKEFSHRPTRTHTDS
jgi:hypothetical protein